MGMFYRSGTNYSISIYVHKSIIKLWITVVQWPPWSYLVIQGPPWCYLVIQGPPWCYLVVQGPPWCYLVIQGPPWCYLVVQGFHYRSAVGPFGPTRCLEEVWGPHTRWRGERGIGQTFVDILGAGYLEADWLGWDMDYGVVDLMNRPGVHHHGLPVHHVVYRSILADFLLPGRS